jgi:UDP-glucose:(glucosyl)LPS alpha-1,2-glucosyltransferase
MEFKITGAGEDTITADGTAANAKGGTERMKERLMEELPDSLKEKFNIICSRVRDVSDTKQNILWLHDLWNDPESMHLKDRSSRERFSKLVFVSNYQWQTYHQFHGIPYSESVVLRNAIDPIEQHEKPKDEQIRLIYHTTPHRGLEILVPVFEALYEKHGDKIVLDVYSNFDIYGWPQRNQPYEGLFEACRKHPGINYHGTVSNDEIREALKKSHIFAYPSIWLETSCIAAIEAMSAGCAVVCPNYGALPETTGNLASIYPWNEDRNVHANYFATVLNAVIENYWHPTMQNKLVFTKNYTDNLYNWNIRKEEWMVLLQSIV